MKSRPLQLLLFAVACTVVAGVALVAEQTQPAAPKMATAASAFLNSLTPEQKSQATFTFDDPHREKWFFTPQQSKERESTRKGIRFDKLDDKQKVAALQLLRSGLSTKGFEQATGIMSLEAILLELEGPKGAMVRNQNWYFVSVFGEPSNTGAWGWRIEGHHLSVNFTMNKGVVVSSSPVVFGVNPAEIKSGPKKGLRTTPEIEDLAKKLIASFNDDQRSLARQGKQYSEIREGFPDSGIKGTTGIPGEKLTPEQLTTLTQLVEAYANRLSPDVAAAELERIKKWGGMQKVFFGYHIDEDAPGKPYTYRVQGTTFVVEFLNVQADAAKNPANHIHSGWRRLAKDDFSVE